MKSLISNNCHGGLICKRNGMQFCSPTVALQILPEEFPKFCANLRHYMETDVVEYKWFSQKHRDYLNHMFGYIPMNMPIGLIDDIMVVFQHDNSFVEAVIKWNRRRERVDYKDIGYLFHLKNESYAEYGRQFLDLHLPNSAVLTEDFTLAGAHRFDVPNGMDCFGAVDGKFIIEQNFSIKDFLGK